MHAVGGELSYWRTPSGNEVDFLWTRGARAIGIEVKASPRWHPEHGAGLKALVEEKVVKQGFGVYLGDLELRDGPLRVLPLRRFLALVAEGEIFA
ncbi:MAG: DUF4143 domain-containing protein [Planctomycetes bacterium]|nr:DUF4143 domain-containing protein [Planctomycetota bacterium]